MDSIWGKGNGKTREDSGEGAEEDIGIARNNIRQKNTKIISQDVNILLKYITAYCCKDIKIFS